MRERYSHIVIGAGAIGSAAAYWLGRAGAERVLVLEQFDLVPALGSSGDHSRIIRHAYGSSIYTELTPAMFDAWTEVEEHAGMQVVLRTGGLDLARTGTPGEAVIESYRAALDARGLPWEALSVETIRERYPQWRLDDDVIGTYQEHGGLLDIRRAVSVMTSLAMSLGVEFRPRTRVTGVALRPGSVSVTAGDDVLEAEHLVVAAGSWLPELQHDLGLDLPITLSQEQVSYVSPSDLRGFAPDRFPIWLYHAEEAGDFYGFPVYGEAAVKIGRDLPGGRFIRSEERVFEGSRDEEEVLLGFLRRHLPDAVGPVLASRTCVYDLTPDRDFIADVLPGHPHVAMFTGAGHAGKFASLMGSVLADLVTKGATAHAIEPFRLDRPALTDPDYVPVWAAPR